jgi:L-lactate dehydrogenase complex protein LldE
MPKAVCLFVPCLVDQLYPEIGISAYQLLRHLGYEVRYYPEATCCGQPAFNAGQREQALKVARNFVDTLAREDAPLVCPSGSCSAMVAKFYPALFAGERLEAAARALSERVVEFSVFLAREGLVGTLAASSETASLVNAAPGTVGFHNSCHSFRELHIHSEPYALLSRGVNVECVDVGEPACCGFGGLFSIKLPGVAAGMAKSRLESFVQKGVRTLVSNDAGCIMQLRKESVALGFDLEVLHLTEFLARRLGLPTHSLDALPSNAAAPGVGAEARTAGAQ